MKITIISLFPDMFAGFLQDSIIKRAQEQGCVSIDFVNPRDFTTDMHKTVDDRPYGGGAGMVLMAEPMLQAIRSVRTNHSCVLSTSPRGQVYSQQKAIELSQKPELIIVAGHYEGMDERVLKEIDEEISLGDYVLTGGELVAGVIVDSVVRLLKGVLKKEEASQEESFFTVSLDELEKIVGNAEEIQEARKKGLSGLVLLEYPHYTRPQMFEGDPVPDVLLSGNPVLIRAWRIEQAFRITQERRPDLFI